MTFTRRYLWLLLALVGIELLSWFSFVTAGQPADWPGPMSLAFVAIMMAAVLCAWRHPRWLAWATIIELVIGGKGYLFFWQYGDIKLSIRVGLFAVLIGAWLWRLLRRRRGVFGRWSWPILSMLAWVGIMSLVGLFRGFGLSAVYNDMNGYLFVALVFPWWYFLRTDPQWRTQAIMVVLAGATLIGIKSWLMQLLFAQDLPWVVDLYRWVRQTGIGEITLIGKNVYRIFFQSQIYALLGLVIILTGYVGRRYTSWWGWALLGSSLAVYLSLSRSLWLGLGGAFMVGLFALIRARQWRTITRLWIILPVGVFVWMMTALALNFPYIIPPPGHANSADAVVERLRSAGSRQASTARANQFPPLAQAILKNPLTGQGFGAMLTYTSTDPRIRGSRTTSAFELGYLDMAFHFGLVGLGLFGWWLWSIGRRLWRRSDAWLWILPSIALITVHLTSPYLNHPLGLGWMALVTLAAYDD